MGKVLTGALILLMLLTQLTLVLARVVVLRGKEQVYGWKDGKRKLLCVSDNDGGGLIWNSNLIWRYGSYAFSDRGGYTEFRNLFNHEIKGLDCELNSYGKCMGSWDTANWSLTNSIASPMGPVFDRRWELFREYNNFETYNEYRQTELFGKTGAIAFSIRAAMDAHILLCDSVNYETDFCLWVIIGGWSNSKSVIRKCAKGVPPPAEYPDSESECAKKRDVLEHEPLSATEWKTFVLTWDEGTRNISLYDTERLLVSYADAERESGNKSEKYYFFLRSPVATLFRFHTYSFLHTADSKAIMTSPAVHQTGLDLCIELLVGLCAECEMEIVSVDGSDSGLEDSLATVKGLSMPHGLPMWQHVKINKTLSSDFVRSTRVKLIPKLAGPTDRPLWAVANVRACPPAGAVRYGVMEASKDFADETYYWPTVTCQKLFYEENVVVDSVPDATLNLQFEDLYCPEGKIGPYCSISCKNHMDNDGDCRGTVICENGGCTCSPGFVGKDCRTNCNADHYGHDCKEACGQCSRQRCNFKTGVCVNGCDNSKSYFIPPFCKTALETLPKPQIDFVNETTVRAILPAKAEYKEAAAEYIFLFRKEEITSTSYTKNYERVNANTTLLIGDVDGLEPGTVYWISCLLYVANSHIPIAGEWQNFTTRCTPNTEFEVEVGERNMVLTGSSLKDDLYSCPEKWYELAFEDVEGATAIVKANLNYLPREFLKLNPYTLYKITIGKGNAVLYSREVRTLEGAPSVVRNLQKILSGNDKVTLKWEEPKYPNGKIVKYEVILVAETYFGCEDLDLPTPQNNSISTSTASTTIIFSDLHPYARYVAKISACTSHRGPEAKTEFFTEKTDLPTAVFDSPRFQDNTLVWDVPKDCTTISGPIRAARIIVTGVSELVKEFSVTKQTQQRQLKLEPAGNYYGAETYMARIYVLRGFSLQHNELLYQKLIFKTPPRAPPPVRNLEIYEVGLKDKTISLRWQEPQPPINGEIQHYVVAKCNKNCQTIKTVPAAKRCEVWADYVCATVPQPELKYTIIAVSAVNANVSAPGKSSTAKVIRYETAPEAPENFTLVPLAKGLVNATWSHPWRPGGTIEKFLLIVELTSTELRRDVRLTERGAIYEHAIPHHQPLYREVLHLLPSSSYRVTLRAVTSAKTSGEKIVREVRTPISIGFESELTAEVYNVGTTISLHIPCVANDTRNSVMHVVVKGPQPCEHYASLGQELCRQAGIKYYEIAWRAATFPTREYAGRVFAVGDNEFYSGATNCPLKPEESYVIVVIVQTEVELSSSQIMVVKTTSIRIGEAPKRHDGPWFVTVVLILVGLVAAYCFYRRKRPGLVKEIVLQDEMALAQSTESTDSKTVLPSTKPVLRTPTPSGKETPSRTSTPDGTTGTIDVSQKEQRTSLVRVKDFEDFVKKIIKSGMLDRQYDTFPRGQTKPWNYGKLQQNKSKNRYGNLIAYDESRVVLEKLPDDPYSDYINANYIKGYKKEKCYIATQGPKTNTVLDFWRMIWQEQTAIICMVANVIEGGKTKCEQYWPDIGKRKKYGDLVVFNAKHNVFADYTFRTFHVTRGDETRKIEHLHYTTWPDHGVPLYTHSVVTYLKKLLATPPGTGPVVVHCSAGVGRTGTIILCDICLRRAAAEGVVDVFAETEAIRSQRANMVDNRQQYLLAHLTLVECLLSFPTALPCNEVLPARIKELKKQLVVQQQRLQDTAWQDGALRPLAVKTPLSERNLAKNRFPELVSDKASRVYLKRYPAADEDSDYIAAVYVDGVKQQNQYLATQLPLPSTFNDFWRMVAEFKVELIVMLQPPDPLDPTCCPITPTSGEFKPTPYINITTKELVDLEYHTSQKLVLIDNSEKPAREQHVTILCLKDWKPGREQHPPAAMALVTVWQATERISRGEGPTVVLCHDGVTGCGLYLALSFLLERMAVERECDVCLAVRAVRRSRPDFVRSLEHLEYLYDAAITYLEYFETYANFT